MVEVIFVNNFMHVVVVVARICQQHLSRYLSISGLHENLGTIYSNEPSTFISTSCIFQTKLKNYVPEKKSVTSFTTFRDVSHGEISYL